MKKLSIICILLLTGCSTILEGRSQEITINTSPEGANCSLLRKGEELGTIESTPGSLYVEKTKYDIYIKCNKKGYDQATYMDHSGADIATAGNLILGGFIGWGIDSATGSDNKYDSPVNITLPKK